MKAMSLSNACSWSSKIQYELCPVSEKKPRRDVLVSLWHPQAALLHWSAGVIQLKSVVPSQKRSFYLYGAIFVCSSPFVLLYNFSVLLYEASYCNLAADCDIDSPDVHIIRTAHRSSLFGIALFAALALRTLFSTHSGPDKQRNQPPLKCPSINSASAN